MSAPKKNKIKLGWLLPIINDLKSAENLVENGFLAAIFIISLIILNAILGDLNTILGIIITKISGVDPGVLVDVSMFWIIACGLYKMSRTAAIAGLCLYLIETIHLWLIYGLLDVPVTMIIILLFANSIRGTFAYHKFKRNHMTLNPLHPADYLIYR
jgi:hypothetical protein